MKSIFGKGGTNMSNDAQYKGWICLHRQIMDTKLFPKRRKMTQFEAWITILLIVNHKEDEFLLHDEIIKCGKGESVMSLKSWAKTFHWSIQNVRTFFKLLQRENMIVTKGMRKSTRLTVCNYDYYQTQPTSIQQPANNQLTTNNNVNNENNKRAQELNEMLKTKKWFDIKYINGRSVKTFEKLLKNYSKEDINKAIENGRSDSFWCKNFLTPNKLINKDRDGVLYIDKFLQLNSNANEKKDRKVEACGVQ